jgi:hypothetical protein
VRPGAGGLRERGGHCPPGRGALLYLHTLTDTPTFLDLYYLLTDLMGMDEGEAAEFLEDAGLDDETVRRTLEAISKLESAALTAVLNRISNFVLPPGSLTARAFCSRRTSVPFADLLRPGYISAFSLPTHALPEELYFEVRGASSPSSWEGLARPHPLGDL